MVGYHKIARYSAFSIAGNVKLPKFQAIYFEETGPSRVATARFELCGSKLDINKSIIGIGSFLMWD